MNTTNTKKGRPNKEIQWPTDEFTVGDLYYKLTNAGSKVSRSLLLTKANKMIQLGKLQVVKHIKMKHGRPARVLKFITV